jgi:DNA-binding NarL/FixJ family response regulator
VGLTAAIMLSLEVCPPVAGMSSPPKHPSGMSNNHAKCRVFLVEDHPLFRRGVAELINQEPDLEVCGEAAGISEAISGIEQLRPDLVIVDISLKGTNGIELLKAMRAREPKLLTLVLSMHDESLYAERALRAGARGYVMKHEAPEQVMAALRKVLRGGLHLSPAMGMQLVRRFVDGQEQPVTSLVQSLSDRELEVLQLIGRGLGTRQVAEQLRLSVKTIESHRAHIKEKLNLPTAPAMVRFAVEWVAQQHA